MYLASVQRSATAVRRWPLRVLICAKHGLYHLLCVKAGYVLSWTFVELSVPIACGIFRETQAWRADTAALTHRSASRGNDFGAMMACLGTNLGSSLHLSSCAESQTCLVSHSYPTFLCEHILFTTHPPPTSRLVGLSRELEAFR